MVKPQFELGRGRVGKGGVVRSAADRREAVAIVAAAAAGARPGDVRGRSSRAYRARRATRSTSSCWSGERGSPIRPPRSRRWSREEDRRGPHPLCGRATPRRRSWPPPKAAERPVASSWSSERSPPGMERRGFHGKLRHELPRTPPSAWRSAATGHPAEAAPSRGSKSGVRDQRTARRLPGRRRVRRAQRGLQRRSRGNSRPSLFRAGGRDPDGSLIAVNDVWFTAAPTSGSPTSYSVGGREVGRVRCDGLVAATPAAPPATTSPTTARSLRGAWRATSSASSRPTR